LLTIELRDARETGSIDKRLSGQDRDNRSKEWKAVQTRSGQQMRFAKKDWRIRLINDKRKTVASGIVDIKWTTDLLEMKAGNNC